MPAKARVARSLEFVDFRVLGDGGAHFARN